jgi:penicillin-binding protein 1A
MNFTKKGIQNQKKALNSLSGKLGNKFKILIIKLLVVAVILTGVVGCCMAFGVAKGIIDNAPDISSINVTPTSYATKIYDNAGNEIETLVKEGSNRVYATLDNIPLNLQHAFVAIEDERFYTHNGIDLKGIARAAMITIQTRSLSQGASTITQQLIKNTVFENFVNESTMEKIQRKLQEQYLAIQLDASLSKDAILEKYLNVINLGNGNLGVQAAANNYFNKDVSELTLSECAVIAAITQSPYANNPIRFPDNNAKRRKDTLDKMKELGFITQAEYDEAIADNVYDRIQDVHEQNESSSIYSYFTDALIDVVLQDLQEQKGYTYNQAVNVLYSGGLSIYSTQDTAMQEIADTILNDPANYPEKTLVSISLAITALDANGKVHQFSHNTMQKYFQTDGGVPTFTLTFDDEETANAYIKQYKDYLEEQGYIISDENLQFTIQPQISFTLMDQYTGEVKVIVGGRGDKQTSRSLNRATDTYRSPGSTIKPLADYGPALDIGGMTLATVFNDAPYYYKDGGKLVTNYEKNYLGLMSMRYAIQQSRNVPAVKCLNTITPALGFSYLQKFGFTTLVSSENAINGNHDVIEALALGGMTHGVYNIELCAAYAAYANNGIYTEPVYYTKVYDHDGNLLLDNTEPETRRIVKESTAWLMTSALRTVMERGTGFKAKLDSQPAAGKTGTSNSNSDLWLAAYTPYYTAVIWTGLDDNSPITSAITVDHRALWAKIMNAIHADLPVKEFPTKPDNIVEVEVCSQSGKRPVAGVCDQDPRGSCVQTEYFAVGTEPAEDDYCDVHVKYSICNETGELSTGTCPSVTDHIYIQKPEENIIIPENAASAAVPADQQYTVPENMTTTFCHVHNTASTEPTTSNSLFGENPDSEVEADTGYVSEAEAETENHDTPEDNLWESTSEDTTSAEGHSKSNRGFRFYSRD